MLGGITAACTELGEALYEKVFDTIVPVSSAESAELVKLYENTFRMINIALANEMAQVCERLDVDVWEVIDAAGTKPFGFMKFTPGPGLGGHCIPLDPHYLSWKMRTLAFKTRMIELSSEINAEMPGFVVRKVADALNEEGKAVKGSRLLVLGVAYKRDIDDLRESPALEILQQLQARGAQVAYHDPYCAAIEDDGHTPLTGLPLYSQPLTDDVLAETDAVVIVTDHSDVDYRRVRDLAPLVVDARGVMRSVPGAGKVVGLSGHEADSDARTRDRGGGPMSRYDDLQADLRQSPRRWLVTGAAGFIGSHLVETLLGLGQHVVGLDNFATGSRANVEAASAVHPDRFRFVEGDIRSLDDCRAACEGVDVVLHQAALGSVPRSIKDPLATHATNVDGFVNMLVAARDAGIGRFVYASSSSVYGDHPGLPKVEDQIGTPLSPYAVSKRVDELYARTFQDHYPIETVGLRYFNVFGPRQDPNGPYAAVIPRWLGEMLDGTPSTIFGDGETSRDFCYVANVVQANLLAAFAPTDATGTVYNVAYGDRTTLNGALRRRSATGLSPRAPNSTSRRPTMPTSGRATYGTRSRTSRRPPTASGIAPTHSVQNGSPRRWLPGHVTPSPPRATPFSESLESSALARYMTTCFFYAATLLVTGGAGFIGSAFVRHLILKTGVRVVTSTS